MEKDDPIDKIVGDIYSNYNEKYVKDAFVIVKKLFNNIINNPDETKFKIFKKTNINIQLKVLFIKEFLDLIKLLGYEDKDEECLIFKGDISRLKYATYVLTNYIGKIEEHLAKQEKEEEEKRQEEIRRQIEETNKYFMEQKLEKERLRQQCLNDRKEMSQKPKAKDSKATNMKFGMKEMKVEFKCSGGAGGG